MHDRDMAALSLDEIPSPNAPYYPDISTFARSYNAFERLGGFEPVAEIANATLNNWRDTGDLPNSLATLRTCLFFEQRRYHHFGQHPPDEDMAYIRAVIEGIRSAVADPHDQ